MKCVTTRIGLADAPQDQLGDHRARFDVSSLPPSAGLLASEVIVVVGPANQTPSGHGLKEHLHGIHPIPERHPAIPERHPGGNAGLIGYSGQYPKP